MSDVAPADAPTDGRAAGGAVKNRVCFVSDVSRQVVEREEQERSFAVEHDARTTLDLIVLVSDLLSDLDYPYVLREISSILERGVVGWAGFFLEDGGLRFAEGINVHPVPTRGAHRVAREAGAETDALGDASAPGASTGLTQVATTFIDPLRDLLDGLIAGPISFQLRTDYPVGTTARWLAGAVRERMGLAAGRLRDDVGQQRETGHDHEHAPTVVVSSVPGRRRVLGVLVTSQPELPTAPGVPGGTDRATMTLLDLVSRRVGMAIDNVRLYAREHHLAETLQRAMLPEQAEIPGLDVWTFYAPTAEHAQVGGDWYDVLQIDDGVAGLVIGDVVGHDIEAAAAMGQLRSVVRSYAFELTTPGTVLERVDQLLVGMRIPRSASLVYATLRQAGESGWELEYSRAGHLPPLLVRDGEVRQMSGAGGALIGFGSRSRETAAETLQAGDALIFYTDGLIERRDRSLRDGLTALVDASERVAATDAAGIGEELLARLADAPEDDVAVVVVRVPDPVGDSSATTMSPRSRRWLLPSEPASIGRARHAVLRTCQVWEIGDVANAELVVSELVANGVLHGWGHIALRLFDTGDGLRIEVEDSNPAPPVTTDGHANRMGGYGMQIVERLADWGWRPSGTGKLVWAKVRENGGRPRG
jgi:serine phosphatase RsbU (regulator of sigma subunit)